jgi:5-methylcytosine-specific restriction protein B
MNTADRSIALLDVALRRRFEFEELMPDVAVLRSALTSALEEGVDGEDLDLTAEVVDLICAVFERLNHRITLLLDRDHQIGHSELMRVRSAADLHAAFYKRIFPLLQEYFYNDRDRLIAVCGEYDASAGSGFVISLADTYGAAVRAESVYGDAAPWEFHRYKVGELAGALEKTFVPS